MELAALSSFLFMGFALGLAHAFDPDHLAAVGGLSAAQEGNTQTLSGFGNFRFAIHWSFGHGSALLLIALFVFLADAAIPVHLSAVAEHSVAFVLIVIGLSALWKLIRQHHSSGTARPHSRRVGAPLVGLIHGTAGSAPLLALIPISQLAQPLVGVVYVLFFSAGVVLAMTTLGGVFAHSMRMVRRFASPMQALIQGMMAAFSLFLGLYLAFFTA